MPALMALFVSSSYGHNISDKGQTVIFCSIIAALLGYLIAIFVSGAIRKDKFFRRRRTDVRVARVLLIFGVFAMTINLAAVGSIPLLFGGYGRVQLQSSILWNIYILGVLGVFLFSRNSTICHSRYLDRKLVWLYFALAILSAWKGTFLLLLTAFFAPKMKNKKINLTQLIIGSVLVFVVFFALNFLRGSDSPADVLLQVAYYVMWGFVNFDIEAMGSSSDCIHSVPIIGCQFSVENQYLDNPTWNVFTALSPIYIDGGIILVVIMFFLLAAVIGYLECRSSSVLGDYIYFLISYFFLMAHNAYAFYSSSFFVSIALISTVCFAQAVSRVLVRSSKVTFAIRNDVSHQRL